MSTFKRTFYSKTGNIKLQVNKSNVAQLFSATKKELGMRSQVGFILAFQAAVWKSFHRIFFISQKQQARQNFFSQMFHICNFLFYRWWRDYILLLDDIHKSVQHWIACFAY